MNRIQALFSAKKINILNVYCTAGFPNADSTVEVLNALQQHGADMIEIGIPYSDPLADGPVIQQSNMLALKNGMTIKRLFEQLKNFKSQYLPLENGSGRNINTGRNRRRSENIPLILMGYLNPVLQYGIEKFCEEAKQSGVDGVILPDLPLYEFETDYKDIFQKNDLDFVFLITPETSIERIKKIDEISSGFIYAVSSSSTTGKDTDLDRQKDYFIRISRLNLKNPVLVGFGIKDKQTFKAACQYTNGAIIGSAYINALRDSIDINASTKEFLNKILN